MSGRSIRALVAAECAVAAVLVAAAAATGSNFFEAAAAGLVLGAANFAAVCLISRRFLSSGTSGAGKVVLGLLAASKFAALAAAFYAAVALAGLSPAGLAAGFTLSLSVPVFGALAAAVRAADEAPAGVFERASQCRTE
jgi:hypothetical protein